MTLHHPSYVTVGAAFGATVLAGTMFPAMTLIKEAAPPVMVGFWRLFTSALTFAPCWIFESQFLANKVVPVAAQGRPRESSSSCWKYFLFLSTVGYAVYNGGIAMANTLTSPAHVVIFSQSAPVILGMKDVALGDKSKSAKCIILLALAIFFFGSLLLVAGNPKMAAPGTVPVTFGGNFVAFLAASGLALTTEYEFRARRVMPIFKYMTMKLLLSSLLLLFVSLVMEDGAIRSVMGWMADNVKYHMCFIAIVPGLISLGGIGAVAPFLSPLVVAAIQGTEPVFAILCSWIVGSDSIRNFTSTAFFGAIFVFLSCFMIIFDSKLVETSSGFSFRKIQAKVLLLLSAISLAWLVVQSSIVSFQVIGVDRAFEVENLGFLEADNISHIDSFMKSMNSTHPTVYRAVMSRKSKPVLRQPSGGRNGNINIIAESCVNTYIAEMTNTIDTCFDHEGTPLSFNGDFTLAGSHFDLSMTCFTSYPQYAYKRALDEKSSMCSHVKQNKAGQTEHGLRVGLAEIRQSGQRRMGGISGLWGPVNTMGDKSQICKLSSEMRDKYGVGITMPCFSLPEQLQVMKAKLSSLDDVPYWIFKPAMSTSGKGISFVGKDKIMSAVSYEKGTIQGYMDKPFLLNRSRFDDKNGKHVKLKLDLRIYGVQTAVQPMRLYVSKFGYFRTGHPDYNFTMTVDFSQNSLMHATNNGAKINKGVFVNNAYQLPAQRVDYDPKMEESFSSAGTLFKFWELVEEAGLDREVVWGNILALFARAHAGGQTWMKNPNVCKSTKLGSEKLCNQEFIPFFADVGIDSQGEVMLYETHPACNLKPCDSPLGSEMEGCYHPVVTEYGTRPAAWGTTVMGFSRFVDPDFQVLAAEWIGNKLQSNDGVNVKRCQDPKCGSYLFDGCLSSQMEELLIQMAHEDYMSCKLGVDDALFLLKTDHLPAGVQLKGSSTTSNLRTELETMLDKETLKIYELYRQFDLWSLANHVSSATCQQGLLLLSDTVYFGRGSDHGCSSDKAAFQQRLKQDKKNKFEHSAKKVPARLSNNNNSCPAS